MADELAQTIDWEELQLPEDTPSAKREKDDDEEAEETWEQEGFASYDEYEKYYVDLVEDLLDQAKKHWKPIKRRWMDVDKRYELENPFGGASDLRPTRTDLAMVPTAVEKSIAAIIEALPRPSAAPKQVSDEDMSGALNYFMNEALDSNWFELLMARVVLDMKRFGLGVVKQSIDSDQTGPFGQPVKIVLTKTDPRYVWADPFAKSWRWEDMRYLIVAEPFDLADIRNRFTSRGFLVEPEGIYSRKNDSGNDEHETFGGTMEIVSANDNGYKLGERQRALVKECWLKDETRHFVQDEDENGDKVFDSEGKPIGKMLKKYPNGRLIITSNRRLLIDSENPFRHKQPPYTFFLNRLSDRLFTFGDIELLSRLEDKVNIIHKDMMKNARVNINSPYVVSNNAFDSREKFNNITNEETQIIVKNQGAELSRLVPSEFPQFVFPLVGWLQDMFNDLSGISTIMQGGLQKGAQLSGDAIQNLQGSSAGGLKVKAMLFEQGLQHLGYLLQWNIRQEYATSLTIDINDPSSGKTVQVKWDADANQPDYSVDIQVGSSLPGTKQGAQSLALTLYDKDAIDRQALLDAYQYPGRNQINARIEDRIKKEAQLAAAGVQASLDGKGSSKAGRKSRTNRV